MKQTYIMIIAASIHNVQLNAKLKLFLIF